MERFNRAIRVQHTKRLKQKRSSFWYRDKSFMTKKKLGMALHTPAMCSCYQCGNPRKWFKERTIQELGMFQDKLYL